MAEMPLPKNQPERSEPVSSVKPRKAKQSFYPEDMLNQAVVEYWRNRMNAIMAARAARGEK